MKEYKIVIMGSGGVGKSAMTLQYVQAEFIEKYDPTIEDSYKKVVDRTDGESVALDILDTAGAEQFTAMRDMYIKNGDGFLLVYSITSPATLRDLQTLKDRLERVKPGRQVVLVGNKNDLSSERSVSYKQGENVAKKWGCPFVESSAKNRSSVEEAFNQMINELDKQDNIQRQNRERNSYNNNSNNTCGNNPTNSKKQKKRKCIIS